MIFNNEQIANVYLMPIFSYALYLNCRLYYIKNSVCFRYPIFQYIKKLLCKILLVLNIFYFNISRPELRQKEIFLTPNHAKVHHVLNIKKIFLYLSNLFMAILDEDFFALDR